jgi:hypothetical protein
MAIGLPASRKNTRGLEGNTNAKSATTSERGSQVVVDKVTQRFHQQLERFDEEIHQQLPIHLQAANINSRGSLHPKI